MIRELIIATLVLFAITARAELVIEITEGNDSALPIAIVPFGWKGAGAPPADAAFVVAADLERSGQFAPLARGNMLSQPQTQEEVYYRDWKKLGVEYLVIGQVEQKPAGGYRVSFDLYNVFSQQRIHSEQVSETQNNLRGLAHYVSDKVYEKITGVRGAFSTKILYVTAEQLSAKKFKYQLQVADADGHGARSILTSDEPILSASWAPDGKRVAYVSFETGRPAIYVQNRISGKREKLTSFKGLNSAPAWSPDGQQLAMTLSRDGNPEIYIMDLASKQLRRVTNHFAIDTEPSWTPDGKHLIFTSNRGGKPQIYQVTLATGWVERLTFDGDYNARGIMLDDGIHLVMVHRNNGVFHIALQNLNNGRLTVLTKTHLDESPTVAPNGSMLIYATKRNNRGILAAVSMDGRVKFRLPSTHGDVREPAWSPFLD